MESKLRIVYLLISLLGGLLVSLSGNTLVISKAYAATGGNGALMPEGQTPILVAQQYTPAFAESSGVSVFAVPSPVMPVPVVPRIRVALLLPLNSESLRPAAMAVQAGFLAAAERDQDNAAQVVVIDSGEVANDVLATYANATQDFDIIVGPLTRSGVAAIAQGGNITKPTVGLAQIEPGDDINPVLPRKMLNVGLSIEDEARQVAKLVASHKRAGKILAVSGPAAWQNRAAKAFTAQLHQLGHEADLMELTNTGAYLSADSLIQLNRRIQAEQPAILFAALDAWQARQMRLLIGGEPRIYGTSQLNPIPRGEWDIATRMPEMNGVQLIDIPWQLQADHPAVMAYPAFVTPPEQVRNADLERLYALGIDAFRVAKQVALNKQQFQIDGVTGTLQIDLKQDRARFNRIETPAIYRDGMVVPLAAAP